MLADISHLANKSTQTQSVDHHLPPAPNEPDTSGRWDPDERRKILNYTIRM